MILAVDSGTTSTRAWLLADGAPAAHAEATAGARDVARTNERARLLERVSTVADDALRAGGSRWESVEAVIAFGMITSEFGLEEVPHLNAPVGTAALASALEERRYPELFPTTLFLVPGVLSLGDGDPTGSDVMRGEETEVVGLLSLGQFEPPFVYLSTGSHTKFVAVDADGRIEWSLTTLSGELLWAVRRETILAGLLDLERPVEDFEALERGAALAESDGLSRALFAARLLNRVHGATTEACSAFIHGAVAGDDVRSLVRRLDARSASPRRLAIGGAGPLADAYAHLLERKPRVGDVHRLDQPLGALGAWALYTTRRGARTDGQKGA